MLFVTRLLEKVTFTFLKVTFSAEKMTFTILKMTFSNEKVTFLWQIIGFFLTFSSLQHDYQNKMCTFAPESRPST